MLINVKLFKYRLEKSFQTQAQSLEIKFVPACIQCLTIYTYIANMITTMITYIMYLI